MLWATEKFLMQKAEADGVAKRDLSPVGRKRRKLALSVVLISSMLLQRRRGCLAGLGVACCLYITFTAKMKPAFLKQTLLFPAGLMLRGFDFRLSGKIQRIYSPFLTFLFLSLFLLISRTLWSKSQGVEVLQFFNRHGRKKLPGNFICFPTDLWHFFGHIALCIREKGETKQRNIRHRAVQMTTVWGTHQHTQKNISGSTIRPEVIRKRKMDRSDFQDTLKKNHQNNNNKKIHHKNKTKTNRDKRHAQEDLCFLLGMLLFSHDVTGAAFLPAKISSASNPESQTCLWLFCSRRRNCSSAQLQNFASSRLWASLTSVPV